MEQNINSQRQLDKLETIKINLEMISELSSFSSLNYKETDKLKKKTCLQSIINKIKAKIKEKTEKTNEKLRIKSNLLIKRQIKAVSLRNNDEIISKFNKQALILNNELMDKAKYTEDVLKKLREYVVYITRESNKEKNKEFNHKYDNFKIDSFIESNFHMKNQIKSLFSEVLLLKNRNLSVYHKNKEVITETILKILNKSSEISNFHMESRKNSNANSSKQSKQSNSKGNSKGKSKSKVNISNISGISKNTNTNHIKSNKKVKDMDISPILSYKPKPKIKINKKRKLFSYFNKNKAIKAIKSLKNTEKSGKSNKKIKKNGFLSKIFYSSHKKKESSQSLKRKTEETKLTNELSTGLSNGKELTMTISFKMKTSKEYKEEVACFTNKTQENIDFYMNSSANASSYKEEITVISEKEDVEDCNSNM